MSRIDHSDVTVKRDKRDPNLHHVYLGNGNGLGGYHAGYVLKTDDGWTVGAVFVKDGRVPSGTYPTRAGAVTLLVTADQAARIRAENQRNAHRTVSLAFLNKLIIQHQPLWIDDLKFLGSGWFVAFHAERKRLVPPDTERDVTALFNISGEFVTLVTVCVNEDHLLQFTTPEGKTHTYTRSDSLADGRWNHTVSS